MFNIQHQQAKIAQAVVLIQSCMTKTSVYLVYGY